MVVWRYSYQVSGVQCLAMDLTLMMLESSVDDSDIKHIVNGSICYVNISCTYTLAINYGRYGGGTGPIHFRNPLCTGLEYRLSDCQYDNNTEGESHNDDWGVYCYIGLCSNYSSL